MSISIRLDYSHGIQFFLAKRHAFRTRTYTTTALIKGDKVVSFSTEFFSARKNPMLEKRS